MPGWEYVTSPVETASVIACTFSRGDFPVFPYYHPSHLDADWLVKPVTGLTWLENRFKFSKPVLIDPITARIYRIVRKKDYPSEKDGIHSEMPRLPLLDYPRFITDAALLDQRRQVVSLSIFHPGQDGILSLVESLAKSDCLGVLSLRYGVGYLPADFPKPVIYLDSGVKDQPGKKLHSVTCDNYGAAHEMMTRIIASGKKEIVMLGREGSLNLKQRLDGFRDAMREHGIGNADCRKFVMHHGSPYEVRQCLQKILRQFPDADFIATDSDDLVYRIMDSCNQKEFESVKHIGLSGFGNIHEISDLHRIPTVDQHPWHIGKEAVNALLGIIQNGEPAEPIRIEVPAEVINTEYL